MSKVKFFNDIWNGIGLKISARLPTRTKLEVSCFFVKADDHTLIGIRKKIFRTEDNAMKAYTKLDSYEKALDFVSEFDHNRIQILEQRGQL